MSGLAIAPARRDLAGGGLAWHVRCHGPAAGFPVVLLHGFTGTGEAWDEVAGALARLLPGRPLWAPDLPGHGGTRPLVPDGAWSLALAAEALAAALPAPFDLVGYSLGGRLALHLALAHPGRVRRLALVGANPGLAGDADRLARRTSDETWACLLEAHGSEAFADRWEAQPIFARRATLPPERTRAANARRRAQDPAGLAFALRAFGLGTQANLLEALAGFETPTLWLAGTHDAGYAAIARMAAARMPRARAICIPHAGHDVPLERPRALARVLAAFVGEAPTEEAP